MSASSDLTAEAPKTGPFARDPTVRQRAEEMAIREVLIDLEDLAAGRRDGRDVGAIARAARTTLRMLAQRQGLAS